MRLWKHILVVVRHSPLLLSTLAVKDIAFFMQLNFGCYTKGHFAWHTYLACDIVPNATILVFHIIAHAGQKFNAILTVHVYIPHQSILSIAVNFLHTCIQ